MGVKKLGLDNIALLGERGRGDLSRLEGRDHQENFLVRRKNYLFLFSQEFTHLEEGDHGHGMMDNKATHAVSEVITVMGHVRPKIMTTLKI